MPSRQVILNVYAGASLQLTRLCPTVIDTTTPVFTWTLPEGVVQRRFNVRIQSEEDGKTGLYIAGIHISSDQYLQWPENIPMSTQFDGLVSIEIAISESVVNDDPFEFTSGKHYFVLDRISENLYNASSAYLQWGNAVDPDSQQTRLYNVVVSTEPTFTNSICIVHDVEIPESLSANVTKHICSVTPNTTYFWRVRAYDGYDFGPWTIVNGFIDHLNFPPIVEILSVTPLHNVYGDVEIEFSLYDQDVEPAYIVATYTGGSKGLTSTKMSFVNPLVHVVNGTRKIIWRSGRDERLVSASDYMISLLPYDENGYGQIVTYGPISLDNSAIGGDSGGIGAVDIEFPTSINVALLTYTSITPFQLPVTGYELVASSGYDQHEFGAITPLLIPWQNYAVGSIPHVVDGHGYAMDMAEYVLDRNIFPPGMTILPNRTYKSGSLDLSNAEPDFTWSKDYVGSDGYHIPLHNKAYGYAGHRFGYVKFVRIGYFDRKACTPCGGKGWRIQDLVMIASGVYQRTPCIACSGTRFSNEPANLPGMSNNLSIYVEPYYEPIEDYFYPIDRTSLSMFDGETPNVIKDFRFIYGPKVKVDTVFPPEDTPGVAGTTYQIDAPTLSNGKWLASGVYPFLNFEASFGVKSYSNYDPPYRDGQVSGSVAASATRMKDYIPLYGSIAGGKTTYQTGYGPNEARGFSQRLSPTNKWEKGIYPLTGNLTAIEPLEPLKIIYLQSTWDAYNTIHWQATISSVSRIHLQVAKFFEDGSHTEYVDVMAEGSEFFKSENAYLVSPNVWHTYWDTATKQLLESGYDYKLRIRQFDMVSKTFSQWVYSSKFIIDHMATNPPNVMSTTYEPWSKILYITFRLDDSGNDRYDVTRVWYSLGAGDFIEVKCNNLVGNRHDLSSYRSGFNPDGSPSNVHVIGIKTKDFKLDPNNKYRVRLEVLPTAIVNGATVPIFKWAKYDNPQLRKAELRMMELQGYLQKYAYNEDTGLLEAVTPMYIPGQIDRLQDEINELELQPPPSGKYNFYAPPNNTGVLTDNAGYNAWMMTEIHPNITRSAMLIEKADVLDEMRNVEIPKWFTIQSDAEMDTRRYLIDQGFYCNGFNDNDAGNGIFRFRVESMPTGDAAFDNEGNYSPTYTARLEVYHRLQLDFFATFDSQPYARPLRDILFNSDGSRMQGGKRAAGVRLTQDGVFDPSYDATIRTWKGFDDNTGKPWDSGTKASSDSQLVTGDVTKSSPTYDDPVSTYTLPKADLPGERNEFFVNNSFPSVSDILPSGKEEFNGPYYWRVASYNLVEGPCREVPRTVIDSAVYYPSTRNIVLGFTIYADEELQEASLDTIYYTLSAVASGWSSSEAVQFPTDRPVGNEAQSDDNPVVWIPYGLNRSRPSVFITNEHQFYMWYSKNNCFGQPTIMHGRGKSWNCFGEYEQVFPKETNKTVAEFSNASAIYTPMVLSANGLYYMYMTIYGTSNRIAMSKAVDASDWSSPSILTDLPTGSYSPCCVYKDDVFHLWYCRTVSGISKVFYATSSDGLTFTIGNYGNCVLEYTYNINTPWVILTESGYQMYYTKYDAFGVSNIFSSISTDGVVWGSEVLEIATENSSNPCVVSDLFHGQVLRRIYYNVQVDDDIRIHTAVNDGSTWIQLSPSTYGIAGDKSNLDCSLFGKSYSISFNLNSEYLPGDLRAITDLVDVRFRLIFVNDATVRNFIIQSDWIDSGNAADYDASIYPETFNYRSEIKNFDFTD